MPSAFTWIFSGIGVTLLLKLGEWLYHRRQRSMRRPNIFGSGGQFLVEPKGLNKLVRPRHDIIVFPVSFYLETTSQLPEAIVHLLVVNLTDKPLLGAKLSAEDFSVSPLISLDKLSLDDVDVGPKDFRLLHCRRRLIDSETRAIQRGALGEWQSGTVTVAIAGMLGKKPCRYINSSLAIEGRVAAQKPGS